MKTIRYLFKTYASVGIFFAVLGPLLPLSLFIWGMKIKTMFLDDSMDHIISRVTLALWCGSSLYFYLQGTHRWFSRVFLATFILGMITTGAWFMAFIAWLVGGVPAAFTGCILKWIEIYAEKHRLDGWSSKFKYSMVALVGAVTMMLYVGLLGFGDLDQNHVLMAACVAACAALLTWYAWESLGKLRNRQ